MKSLTIRNSSILICVNVIVILLAAWHNYSHFSQVMLSIILIMNSVIMLCYSTKRMSTFLFSLFIFISNYSIAVGIYLYQNIRPDILYYQITNDAAYGISLVSMLIFSCFMTTTILHNYYKDNKMGSINSVVYTKPNRTIETVCFITYAIIFFTQTKFTVGERMDFNALSEYRFLFAIIGGMYSTKSKKSMYCWGFLIGVTTLISLIGGNRVDAFPGIFIFLIVWCKALSVKKTLIFSLIAIPIIKVMGSLRGNIVQILDGTISFFDVINGLFKDKFVQDTFTYAYFPSVASVELSMRLPSFIKTDVFWENIKYIIYGGEFAKYTLSGYTYNYYAHSYGYLAPVNLYFWFGHVGTIILGVIFSFLLNVFLKIERQCNYQSMKYAFFLVFICLLPRWYSYNLFQLPRAFIFIIILYAITKCYLKIKNASR